MKCPLLVGVTEEPCYLGMRIQFSRQEAQFTPQQADTFQLDVETWIGCRNDILKILGGLV